MQEKKRFYARFSKKMRSGRAKMIMLFSRSSLGCRSVIARSGEWWISEGINGEANALTEAARTGQRKPTSDVGEKKKEKERGAKDPRSKRRKRPRMDARSINATNGIQCRRIVIDAMLTHSAADERQTRIPCGAIECGVKRSKKKSSVQRCKIGDIWREMKRQ